MEHQQTLKRPLQVPRVGSKYDLRDTKLFNSIGGQRTKQQVSAYKQEFHESYLEFLTECVKFNQTDVVTTFLQTFLFPWTDKLMLPAIARGDLQLLRLIVAKSGGAISAETIKKDNPKRNQMIRLCFSAPTVSSLEALLLFFMDLFHDFEFDNKELSLLFELITRILALRKEKEEETTTSVGDDDKDEHSILPLFRALVSRGASWDSSMKGRLTLTRLMGEAASRGTYEDLLWVFEEASSVDYPTDADSKVANSFTHEQYFKWFLQAAVSSSRHHQSRQQKLAFLLPRMEEQFRRNERFGSKDNFHLLATLSKSGNETERGKRRGGSYALRYLLDKNPQILLPSEQLISFRTSDYSTKNIQWKEYISIWTSCCTAILSSIVQDGDEEDHSSTKMKEEGGEDDKTPSTGSLGLIGVAAVEAFDNCLDLLRQQEEEYELWTESLSQNHLFILAVDGTRRKYRSEFISRLVLRFGSLPQLQSHLLFQQVGSGAKFVSPLGQAVADEDIESIKVLIRHRGGVENLKSPFEFSTHSATPSNPQNIAEYAISHRKIQSLKFFFDNSHDQHLHNDEELSAKNTSSLLSFSSIGEVLVSRAQQHAWPQVTWAMREAIQYEETLLSDMDWLKAIGLSHEYFPLIRFSECVEVPPRYAIEAEYKESWQCLLKEWKAGLVAADLAERRRKRDEKKMRKHLRQAHREERESRRRSSPTNENKEVVENYHGLPEGEWEECEDGYFWSEAKELYYLPDKGLFYDPKSELWYDPEGNGGGGAGGKDGDAQEGVWFKFEEEGRENGAVKGTTDARPSSCSELQAE